VSAWRSGLCQRCTLLVQETASLDSRRSQPRRRSSQQVQLQQQNASQRPRAIRRTLTRMETFMPSRSQPSR
jgi:hypothetical protein